MAPGPGRSADTSTSALPVAAMQNTEASVALAGVPVVTAPAAAPFSVMVTHAGLPKQPGLIWPGQKRPVAFVALAVLVVSGERLMGITPTCEPSRQAPPPGRHVQGRLWDGPQVLAAELPPVGQSRVTPVELVVVQ